jgi:hypothetical protein
MHENPGLKDARCLKVGTPRRVSRRTLRVKVGALISRIVFHASPSRGYEPTMKPHFAAKRQSFPRAAFAARWSTARARLALGTYLDFLEGTTAFLGRAR